MKILMIKQTGQPWRNPDICHQPQAENDHILTTSVLQVRNVLSYDMFKLLNVYQQQKPIIWRRYRRDS